MAQTQPAQQKEYGRMVRILSKDIEGNMHVYAGLTKIKGISWSFSSAICHKLGINKRKKIEDLTEAEIKKISESVKNSNLPTHIVNHQKDFETGENKHFVGADLDLRKDFDIKRLKKIKSYRGLRHTLKLPLRGQRTKAHFRSNRMKAGGIKKKKKENEKEA